MILLVSFFVFFFFKQKTAYEMRISDWSSDVCSSDLLPEALPLSDRSAVAGKRHPSLHIQTVAKSSSRVRGRAGYATTAYGQAVQPQLPARRGARSRPGGPRQPQMRSEQRSLAK